MSRFYGSLEGSRGPATRQGTEKSGMTGHIRGWHVGAEVRMYVDSSTEEDVCRVYATHGSGWGGDTPILLAEFVANPQDGHLEFKFIRPMPSAEEK